MIPSMSVSEDGTHVVISHQGMFTVIGARDLDGRLIIEIDCVEVLTIMQGATERGRKLTLMAGVPR